MKLFFLVVVLLFSHCASSQQSVRSVYSFAYQGLLYEIVCTMLENGDGYNVLVYRQGAEVVFSAKDIDQNGVLDSIITGKMAIDEANMVYEYGLRKAKEQGKQTGRMESNIYHISDVSRVYYLETFYNFSAVRNKFTVFNKDHQTEVVLLDSDANGSLDSMEKGTGDIEEYADMYQKVLEQGVRTGSVSHRDGLFIVIHE